jgi:beta-galactosidase
MIFSGKLLIISVFLVLILSFPSKPQFVFNESPGNISSLADSSFYGLSETRQIISLNGAWKVYSADDKDRKKVNVEVPSIFDGTGELVFEKAFPLSQELINSSKLTVVFLGLNYSAEIAMNNVIIYRHTGGEYPFNVSLPKDILSSAKKNILSVKLYYKLDSENTVPVKQRFFYPRNFGGIIRDVFIQVSPLISITDFFVSSDYNFKTRKAKIFINSELENILIQNQQDSLNSVADNNLVYKIIGPSGNLSGEVQKAIRLKQNKTVEVQEVIEIDEPVLWSPGDPKLYTLILEIRSGQSLIDRSQKKISIYSFTPESSSLLFNGENFVMKGVGYVPSIYDLGNISSFGLMEKDLKLIKDAGFNTVRFSKSLPHPYYLYLCQRMGLLVFLELPIYSLPENLARDVNYNARISNYLTGLLKGYRRYSEFAVLGLGGSYLSSSDFHKTFLSNIARTAKKNNNLKVFASFASLNLNLIPDIDFYGFELLNEIPPNLIIGIKALEESIGKGRVIIGEASYAVNKLKTDGYLNKFSFEAQAKYFEDIIQLVENGFSSGFFFNSMFDYRGDFASLISGYSSENMYRIGILGEDRNPDRITYKVISARLNNSERVTIPIGTSKDDSPMIFIISGLFLALLTGVLVNSGKKFREDSSRALLRPYNFFADIRDQRIISGYHSVFLSLIVIVTSALVISNVLFYYKTSIVFEKLILAFGSRSLIKTISYLSWHPAQSIIWLSLAAAVIFVLLVVIIKAASLFVRNRVYLHSIFFTVVWSSLPVILLIPAGIILYRIMNLDAANFLIMIFLILFVLWIIYRLLKGIYVIFDVNPGSVYFYGSIVLLVVAGIFVLYFEINRSVIDFLQILIKQYNLFG